MESLIALIVIGLLIWLVLKIFKALFSSGKSMSEPKKGVISREWTRGIGSGKLSGYVDILEDGSRRMSVKGYVTNRELREVHNIPEKLVKKYFAKPDEIALFDDDFGQCDLHLLQKLKVVKECSEFKQDLNEFNKRSQKPKQAAAKRKATIARKREEDLRERNQMKEAFGGQLFEAECEYSYGWVHLGIYVRDAEQAEELITSWIKSKDGNEFSFILYEKAVSSYEDVLDEYNYAKSDLDSYSKLKRPVKPKKSEFKLNCHSIDKSDEDHSDINLEEVTVLRTNKGWDWDIYSGYI